ncbi:hypothetical protein CWI39_1771p0010 [Hamiltosporidium magnivora]|uniref:Uncharacterized protein n=1 Tax=Hamiltosporidium magnivora TaxID=148818 RepID=A0A4Q9L0V7_9MICR|nr:hypothetical protein CWI39_1771p0010 [Hamiltosporidium magnivora]
MIKTYEILKFINIIAVYFLYNLVIATESNQIPSNSSFDNCYRQQCGTMLDNMLFRNNEEYYENLEDLRNIILRISQNHKNNYCDRIKNNSLIGKIAKDYCARN